MKPKYSLFHKFALPALIVLPAVAPIAYGAIINPDAFGNVISLSGTTSADTIIASGGSSSTPVVTIESNASLSGDAVWQNAVRITSPGYTINNSGSLSGGAQGVFVTSLSSSTALINNYSGSLVEGGNDGIFFEGSGGRVVNLGTIRGITGLSSDGIDGLDGMIVVNSGIISGNSIGINAGNALEVTNTFGASIVGSSGYGMDVGDNAVITNQAGAVISGQLGGIRTGIEAVISNSGLIQGMDGDGINLGLEGEIYNFGTIQGTTGLYAVGGAYLVNSGTLRSTVVGGDAFLAGSIGGFNNLVLNQGSLVVGNLVGAGANDTLTFNGGLAFPSGSSNVVRGDVIDFGTITKQGAGVAFIGTVNDVNADLFVRTDTIQINSGGLYINADIEGLTETRATINANGSALGGTGIWDANVNVNAGGFSAGAIPVNLDNSPSNSVGRVSIFGNVVHQSNSFIRLDINPDTVINSGVNSDLIEQFGSGNTYNVAGGNLRISSTNTNRVITAGTYTVIDSDSPILGLNQFGTIGVQFNNNIIDTGSYIASGSGLNYLDSVFTNYFITPGLENGNTNLVIDVDYRFRDLPGLSRNEASIGAALDTLALRAGTGELGAAEQDLISALALSDLETVQASLDAINPESNVDLAIGVINSNYRLHRMVQDRMAMARNQPATVTMTTPPPVMDAKGGMVRQSAVVQHSTASRGSVWGSYSYDWQDFEDRDSIRNSDGDTQAFTIGFDYRTSPGFLIGGLIDGSRSDFDLSRGSSDIDSLRFALYGSFGESLGFYSDFLAGYGTHDLDQSRRTGGIEGLAGRRGFSSDADSLQAMLTAGFAMGNERVKHGPFIGAEYQNLDVDRFSSRGGPLVVGVDDYGIDSLRGLIGYRINGEMGGFRPYISAAYAHEFKDDFNDTTGTIGGVDFDIQGPRLRSAFIVTAGSGFALSQNLMLDIGYRGEIRYEGTGISSHGGTVGLSYSF
jgi:uncharacterized protein YhjY with autotransporter beta-barrel domain